MRPFFSEIDLAKRKQKRAFGVGIKFTAIVAAIAIFTIGMLLEDAFGVSEYSSRYAILLMGLTLITATTIWRYGSRHTQELGSELLARDKRAPIVYLRSFANEGGANASEISFAHMFQDFGPFVAIGAPGEKLPPLGAARLYLEHDNWQKVVSDLVGRALLVIIYGGETPGLGWELNQVRNRMHPTRTVIMVPNHEKVYEQFRVLAKAKADLNLPPFPNKKLRKYAVEGTCGFVSFDQNWNPVFTPLPKAALRSSGQFFDDKKGGGRAWAALGGICRASGIAIAKPSRNWFLSYLSVYKFLVFIGGSAAIILLLFLYLGIVHDSGNNSPVFEWPQNMDHLRWLKAHSIFNE